MPGTRSKGSHWRMVGGRRACTTGVCTTLDNPGTRPKSSTCPGGRMDATNNKVPGGNTLVPIGSIVARRYRALATMFFSVRIRERKRTPDERFRDAAGRAIPCRVYPARTTRRPVFIDGRRERILGHRGKTSSVLLAGRSHPRLAVSRSRAVWFSYGRTSVFGAD